MEPIEGIVSRRLNCGDTALDFMGEGPAGAVNYVLRHRQGVPRDVLAADAGDALELVSWLHTDADRLEYDVITLARSVGVTWARIATRLGLRSAQGAELRYLRLRGQHASGPRDSQYGRKDRQAELRRRQQLAQQEGWLIHNGPAIEQAARAILAADLPEDVQDFAEELSAAFNAPARSYGDLMTTLRMLMIGLRVSGGVDDLPLTARTLMAELIADWDTRFPGQGD